jgi:hypothetical protein
VKRGEITDESQPATEKKRSLCVAWLDACQALLERREVRQQSLKDEARIVDSRAAMRVSPNVALGPGNNAANLIPSKDTLLD